MFEHFKTKAEIVSAEVHRFPTRAGALDWIVGFLREEGVADEPKKYAVWARCPFLDGIDRQQLEAIPGVKLEATRELAADAHVGISQMDWAMADTGTLVQDATAVDKRLVSTLPTIHVALIATDGSAARHAHLAGRCRSGPHAATSPSSPARAAPPTSSGCSPSACTARSG